jgi:hypothetical protein
MRATDYGLAIAAKELLNKGFDTVSIAHIVEEFNRRHSMQEDWRDYIPKVKVVRKIACYNLNIPVFLVGIRYFRIPINHRPDLNTHLNGFKPARSNPSFGLFLPSLLDADIALKTAFWELQNIKTRYEHTFELGSQMLEKGLLTQSTFDSLFGRAY